MARTINGATVVVVTGATSGVGRATVHAFARRGARPALAARDADDLHVAAAEAFAFGAADTCTALTDVSDEESVLSLQDPYTMTEFAVRALSLSLDHLSAACAARVDRDARS